MSKNQVNIRLSEYELELVDKLKEFLGTDSTTSVIEFCITRAAIVYELDKR